LSYFAKGNRILPRIEGRAPLTKQLHESPPFLNFWIKIDLIIFLNMHSILYYQQEMIASLTKDYFIQDILSSLNKWLIQALTIKGIKFQ
jgi:hypothetical protein